jgi:hypothetical protein
VTRVPIELDDFGTANCLTELRRAEGSLSGLYLSFDVWRRLWDFGDGTWFAAIDGAYHDNFVAVSVDPAVLGSHATNPFVLSNAAAECGNVSAQVTAAGFRALDREILSHLGFGTIDDVHFAPARGIRRYIWLHDDFLFSLEPIDDPSLREALRLVVGVHEHYMDLDLPATENDRIAALVERELAAHRRIKLRSNAARRLLTVTHRVRAISWWRRIFNVADEASIEIAVAP